MDKDTTKPSRISAQSTSSCSSSSSSLYSSAHSTPYPIVHTQPPPIQSFRTPAPGSHGSSSSSANPSLQQQQQQQLQPILFSSSISQSDMDAMDSPNGRNSQLNATPSYPPPPLTPLTTTTTTTTTGAGVAPVASMTYPPAPLPTHHQTSSSDQSPDQDSDHDQDGTLSRPRSVMNFAIDSASGNPAGRQVRRNMLTRMSNRWETVPRNSRVVLSLTAFMTFAKVAATVAVLVIDRKAPCVYLKILLLLFAVRSAVGLPFTVYAHLHPRVQGQPLTTRDIILDRQRTMMEIAGTCLFFLANYFLFTQSFCHRDAPAVFILVIVHVVLGYIVILIPVILCLAVILCLPLVLRVMHALDLGPVAGVKGATEEMIAAIPIVKYRTPRTVPVANSTVVEIDSRIEPVGVNNVDTVPTPATATTAPAPIPVMNVSETGDSVTPTATPSTRRSKGRLFGLFRKAPKRKEGVAAANGSSEVEEVEYLTLEDAQDAVCAICLCEYEDDEELRKMKCNHYFHKECVDEWLRLHRNCPLCKRDIEELARSGSGRRQ